jgi:Type ISP C-terminal specificity domain
VVGGGFIEPVPVEVWRYEVGGKQVLVQWFNARKRERERPMIGDRRKPSPLGDIQPDHWLAEYTTELLNVLNVLGLLVDLEPQAAALLDRICSGPLVSEAALHTAGVYFPAGHVPAGPVQSALDGFGE